MTHKLTVSDNNNKPLFNIFDEENQEPSFRHFSLNLNENHQISPNYRGSRTNFTLERVSSWLHQSPGSLSSHSPVWAPSHSSIHYCCISSVHLDGDIYSMAVSKELVFTGSCGRRVHARHPLDCHTKGYIHASSGDVRAMVAHGDLVFTAHKDHKVRLWNVKGCYGACNSSSNNNNNSFKPKKVTTLPSASHFKNFVSKPIMSTLHYKVTNKPIIASHHRDIISCMAYYHVEGILYTGSYDRIVKAWRVNEKKCVDSFMAHVGNVTNMVVDQLNGYLFTCSLDGTLKMWMRVVGAANPHALVKVLAFHTYPIHALALSVCSPSQDSFLYSGSSNGSINFWEQGLSCSYTHGGFLQGHQFSILCLATLENFVISGSEDSTIRIWKRRIGGRSHECLAILEGHRGPVKCLATRLQKDKFASSFFVYSSSSDQTFKVWRIKHLLTEMTNYPFRDDDKENDRNNNHPDLKPTPVLSPSWVKRKLQFLSVHRSS